MLIFLMADWIHNTGEMTQKQWKFGCNGQHAKLLTFLWKLLHAGKNKNSLVGGEGEDIVNCPFSSEALGYRPIYL